MNSANKDPSLRIWHMDEPYIHKNYHRQDDSLFDPNGEPDVQTKAQHKGKRYCFIAPLVDDDKSPEAFAISEDLRSETAQAGLTQDTSHIFEEGKNQTAD